jgi:uncharacterized Tic20 family protein
MSLCSECGGQIRSEAQYCPDCGVSVVDESASQSSQQPPPQQSKYSDASQADARTYAMLCHLATFSGFVIPLGNILGPLGVWLYKRSESPFIDRHGKEAINFQITLTLYLIASAVLIIVLIGIPLLVVGGLAGMIFTAIAALRASHGSEYRYPLTFRFVK